MSRTREFNLPRLPNTSHRIVASVSTLQAVTREQNEFKSFLGTRRQDITSAVLRDPIMFDDVFCKQGRLEEQNAPKADLPLTCRPYNSLHDKHLRRMFVRDPKLRKHLVNQGLITEDMRVCSSEKEVREKIRSHEMLERKELLKQQLEEREKGRLVRLQEVTKHMAFDPLLQAQSRPPSRLPPVLDWSQRQERKRQAMKVATQTKKTESKRKKEEEKAEKSKNEKQLQHQRWLKHLEEEELERERRRHAEMLRQQELRSAHYDRKFANLPRGQQLAEWHKVADLLQSRMIFMQHQVWPPDHHLQHSTGTGGGAAGASRHAGASHSRRHSAMGDQAPRHGGSQTIDALNMDSLKRHLLAMDTGVGEDHSSLALATSEYASQISLSGEAGRPVDDTRQQQSADHAHRGGESTPTTSKASVSSKKSAKSPASGSPKAGATPEKTSPKDDVVQTSDSGDQKEGAGDSSTDAPDEGGSLELGPPPAPQDELEMHILTALQSVDNDSSGFITTEDVLNALQFHSEILEFHEGHLEALQQLCQELVETHHMAVHGPEGCLSYQHALPEITDLIRQASADVVAELYPSGNVYVWSQLPDALVRHTLWFNRETSELALERPADDLPIVRDEFFEETMVNMFIEYDLNQDNLLDRNEFLKLLQSPGVGSRLTVEQVEELWMLFTESPLNSLDFDHFVPFARLLILRIYGNQYTEEEQEWIELSCPICPRFWYSKVTGQTILLPPDILWDYPLEEDEANAYEQTSLPTKVGTLRREDSAYGHLVGDPSTLTDRKILRPVPPPPAQSRFAQTPPAGLAAISEEAASIPSRPGSSAA
eukprot:scpid24520/ scgid0157/ 